MKNALGIMVSASLLLCLAPLPSPAHGKGLGYLARDKRPIKVFVKEFSSESGQAQIIPADFRKEVEKAFVNRKSVSFAVVASPQESDIQVSAAIRGYKYLDRDPVKPSLSVIMAIDAITTENYAELSAEFTVTETASGNTALKEEITAYVKGPMTPAESVGLVYDKLARKFVADSFGKGE